MCSHVKEMSEESIWKIGGVLRPARLVSLAYHDPGHF